MPNRELEDVFPGDLELLADLANRLDDYHAAIAGGAAGGLTRTQARDSVLRARPVLDRLLDQDRRRFFALFDTPRGEDDGQQLTAEVLRCRQELRAVIARARHRVPSARSTATASVAGAAPAHPPATRGTSTAVEEALVVAPQVKVWILVACGVAAGLVLGVFGTRLPHSTGSLARLWTMLQPVVAAAAAGIIGGLLVQDGLQETLRERWRALLVSSLLLIGTAPTALDAGRELLGIGAGLAPAEVPPVPVPDSSPTVAASAAAPLPVPARADADVRLAGSTAPLPARPAASRRAPSGDAARGRSGKRCLQILERQQVGEELTASDQAFLVRECGA